MIKLKQLAAAAAEFYDTPNLLARRTPDDGQTKAARYICHWVASDAGISKGVIARFWKIDRTSVYYGCKMVKKKHTKKQLQSFMEYLRVYIEDQQKIREENKLTKKWQ